jgi:hypothetical protein
MGRRFATALAAVALVALAAAPAAAQEAAPSDGASATPSPTSTIPNLGPQTPGSVVCTVTNRDLDAVTGIIATAGGIVAIEGGNRNRVETWLVNPTTCEASVRGHGQAPRDPQDIVLGADGALWAVDNVDSQNWLTFWRIDPAGGNAVPYRATKPQGEINAKALIMGADNLPIVIAASNASAVLYKPSGPMTPDSRENLPVLTKVGELPMLQTGTPSPRGLFDQRLVSGASMSSDRTKVVVRSMSDAYEFTIGADGDIVTALTTGTPVITPLPNEENAQAITYSLDGTQFLTLAGGENPVLRAYTPHIPPPPPPPSPPPGGGGGLNFGDITMIATVTGVLGLGAVIAGVIGIARFRRGLRDGRGPRDRGPRDDRGRDDYDEDYDYPRAPRPRPGDPSRRAPARVGPGDDYGRGPGYADGGQYGPPAPPYGQGGPGYGPGPAPGYGDPGYGQPTYGQPQPAPPYGQGTVYGGGQYSEPAPPAQPPRRGGTYGRPTPPDDEPPTRRGGYGRDNIDM